MKNRDKRITLYIENKELRLTTLLLRELFSDDKIDQEDKVAAMAAINAAYWKWSGWTVEE